MSIIKYLENSRTSWERNKEDILKNNHISLEKRIELRKLRKKRNKNK